MNIHSVTVDVGGRPLTIETGKLAKQSNGSIVITQDDSQVLVTACASKNDVPFDFLPLTVVYQDRTASFGKIPGGFLKSEGRPNERETLTSRLIDRPIRPQFPKYFRREMQLITTVMSFDPASDTDVLSLCGAAAAFAVSDIPMIQPVAGVRIIRLKGEYIINPSLEQTEESDIALIVAGSREGICMVEGGANEAEEEAMMEAMELAFVEIQKIIGAIEELQAKVNPTKFEVAKPAPLDESIKDEMMKLGMIDSLTTAMAVPGKFGRGSALKAARNLIIDALNKDIDEGLVASRTKTAKKSWDNALSGLMRSTVANKGIRIDGRSTDEIRDIWIEIGTAPRVHGSSVFTRGETQAFVTTTLGVDDSVQRVDFSNESGERRWMLQYNFPPYCVGEVRRMAGPKRREIGHGKLAWRAMLPMLPKVDAFPYVIRCSSDILESNGSSSMATVCGATMSMLDAGVPLKAPVAGIAMGLIKEGENYVVLSDILGDEDHLGDMDFKVTGTVNGITAFQMDTKLGSIPREVMNKAMNQAKEGRLHILEKMAEVIDAPRSEMSPYAPRIHTMYIKQDKIREVIGPGGRVIRGIQDECNVKITTFDDGRLDIAATSDVEAKMAEEKIREIIQEPEINKIYLGTVKRVESYGAFVEILNGAEGLVHISEMANERVENVRDVVSEGDEIYVKVVPSDRAGKLKLSRKQALGEGI